MIATSDSGTSGLQFNLSIAMHDGKMIFLLTFEASDSQNLVPLVSTAVLDALHKSSAFGQYYEPELKVQEVKDHDDFDFSMFDVTSTTKKHSRCCHITSLLQFNISNKKDHERNIS